MALDYEDVMSRVETDLPFSYNDRDTILYALSVGMGRDPTDLKELLMEIRNICGIFISSIW